MAARRNHRNFGSKHKRIVPEEVDRLRGEHWAQIRAIETRPGDGIRLGMELRGILSEIDALKKKKKIPFKELNDLSRRIELVLSATTDEILSNDKRCLVKGNPEWDKTYLALWQNIIKHLPALKYVERYRRRKK